MPILASMLIVVKIAAVNSYEMFVPLNKLSPISIKYDKKKRS